MRAPLKVRCETISQALDHIETLPPEEALQELDGLSQQLRVGPAKEVTAEDRSRIARMKIDMQRRIR